MKIARLSIAFFLGLLLTGCDTARSPLPRMGPRYTPSNIYLKSPVLDPRIRRVAVLPMTPIVPTEALQAGVEGCQPLLQAELQKTKRFEVVVVPQQLLARLTGQPRWSAEDKLPQDFFDKLHNETACDAIFFATLTRYQPYQPLAVGWKLNLVANSDHASVWSADELFDAGNMGVANSARDYADKDIRYEGPLDDPDAILSSPSRFSQYTLRTLLATMPAR